MFGFGFGFLSGGVAQAATPVEGVGGEGEDDTIWTTPAIATWTDPDGDPWLIATSDWITPSGARWTAADSANWTQPET